MCLKVWSMLIIFRSVTIVCYSEKICFIFNFVQYFTFLLLLVSCLYFFYSWPQYFWQEINTRKLWVRLKCKPCLIFCHQETCHMSFCWILHFQCFVWKALQRVNSSTGLFTCNWVSRACQSTWARDRCIMQLMQKLMQITFLTIQVGRLCTTLPSKWHLSLIHLQFDLFWDMICGTFYTKLSKFWNLQT